MKLENLSNREIILITFVGSFLIIIILLGLSCFAFVKPEHSDTIRESIMGILLAIMSLIIMLGVAFSFVSIFDAKDDIQRLTDLVNQNRDTKDQVEKLFKKLNDNKRDSKIALAKCEIYSLDMAASGFYYEKRYLQAIKKEFEVIDYIIRNYDYCEEISTSYWGMKRYAISNDIRKLLLNIITNGMPTFALGEFDDIMATIYGKISNFQSCKKFGDICQGENERYQSLMYWIKSILSNLDRQQLDFAINYEAYKSIYIFTKISNGHNPDHQVNIDSDTEIMLKSEYVKFEEVKKLIAKQSNSIMNKADRGAKKQDSECIA